MSESLENPWGTRFNCSSKSENTKEQSDRHRLWHQPNSSHSGASIRMHDTSVRFFMQQPEVHLHPKGQAELSSLLISLMKYRDIISFIVETHSDAMIDRARIEIMKGNISPEDVSLIYLEPKGNSIGVHNITV